MANTKPSKKQEEKCPNCGRCPTCGHVPQMNWYPPYVPPALPYWPAYQPPYWGSISFAGGASSDSLPNALPEVAYN